MVRWFERRWEESRGDDHSDWGGSTWFFEVGNNGWPIRQVEVYDNGPTLRYGLGHESDHLGGLAQARLDSVEDWSPWAISAERFESVWAAES